MEKSMHNVDSGPRNASASRRADRTLTEVVKEQPILCLAMAAAAGFVIGGGVRRSRALTILTLLGEIAVRKALGDLVTEILGNGHDA
jgi:hypothetical protein